ncbi:DUF397 domain-containing protein [Streptomyces sp. enrichment culture]|uniref:DUF397 domain-containing protein n=1 Tax=Streptomyces sp. enrichment culture TaxID=1795815 RepID=UPI003F57C1E7
MSHRPISDAEWISSSYSQANGGECVEWAPTVAAEYGVVPVRDSKRPTGPVLRVSPAAWADLVAMAADARA